MNKRPFDKRAIGDVWIDHHENYCLIIDDDPILDSSLESSKEFGFSYSASVPLETEEGIRNRYDNSKYIADPESILKITLTEASNIPSDRVYVDFLRVSNVSNNSFIKKVGTLEQDNVLELLIQLERFNESNQKRSQGRRNAPIARSSYDYDVAISFAGEEREIARSIASGLRDRGFSVFFDEFEPSALWGSDLGQLLDVIYRKRARYCIALLSKNYRTKIWTRHEFRSALARRIAENPEYILPVRIDDTEMDGLQPTTGYVRYDTTADKDRIIQMFADKCSIKPPRLSSVLFTAKWIENLKQINDLWNIDCIAFVVDRRYVPTGDGKAEHRLGVSYGINVTVPRVGFLAPPEQPGINVLGLHVVAVHERRQLRIEDRWVTSHRADDVENAIEAIRQAKLYLATIDDEHYKLNVSFSDSKNILMESDFNELDEFSEIILLPPESE